MSADPIAERRRRRRLAERQRRAATRRRNALTAFAVLAFGLGALIGAAVGGAGPGAATAGAAEDGQAVQDKVPTITGFDDPVPILMYHGIGSPPVGAPLPGLWVPEPELKQQIEWLVSAGYHGVTLDQVFAAWRDGEPIAENPIVISFDDGLRSQYVGAVPVLAAVGWPGVLNLKLNSLEQGELTDAMVEDMIAAGWEIDSHTINHLDLTDLDSASLREEVAGSRRRLSKRFGIPVDFFCYPAGAYDDAAIAAVRDAGYLGATTTEPGLAEPERPYKLGRIRIEPGDGPDGVEAKLAADAGGTDLPAAP